MGYNSKWHHLQQTSPGVSPTSISNLSGFLCPVSVYHALEMTILVILTLRIHVKLVQRLVRGCPDPLGPGAPHSLCIWTESGEATKGQTDIHLIPLSSVSWDSVHNWRLQMQPWKSHQASDLFYATYHVQHDCDVFCLTHIQLCLLRFLASLPGISLRQSFSSIIQTQITFHRCFAPHQSL